ncbi:MAG: tetratricopeptide repeat protein [Methylococcaceae bacterium]|nr:tetratricopeptide repeat protein [Methylococcaceae bacterium]
MIVNARALACLLLLASTSGWAYEQTCRQPVTQLVSALGQVDAQFARRAVWQPAILQQGYCVEDRVRTGALSRAVLAMLENLATRVSLNQNTLVNFLTVADRVVLAVDYGDVHVRSHTPRHFDVTTPFVNAGIEGTEFLVSSTGDQTEVTVFEGTVRLSNAKGKLSLTKGQTGIAESGQAPRIKLLIRPRDAVQWALYYPPIIDTRALLRSAKDPTLRKAINLYQAGRIADAFTSLEQVPEPERSAPDALAFQAALLLTVGQVDQAEPLIRQAVRSKPANASAKSLLAMIALARNDKEQALFLANEAAASEPTSPIPLLARSYAEQARFELDQARESVEAALRIDPENGLAHARHAELLASLGERSKARRAAERATQLNPKLGRARTVLGFTQLMETDTDEATQSFQKAIELDSFDPLAHFGLGLAKIRNGDLEPGTEDIEVAANLDPNDSLIRSYLGKAYYEQKRNELAETQFELARQYDPKDPTPHFYDAIKKQTENRPVEALHDLQRAIELNDNRAVYRSKQLLDSDSAARSAALGRIYSTLTFEQMGFLQGWKASIRDPNDFSAHRLLGDLYTRLPRHDIARASELLQSQLLQSENVLPISPQLAEKDLLTGNQLGPSTAAFQEFNPLFERNKPNIRLSGLMASNNTAADEALLSGVKGPFSYSLGQFHYNSDGFRENNYIDHNLYTAFAQYQVSPLFTVQTELRDRNSSWGDRNLFFDPRSFSPTERNTLNKTTARVGARFSPNPGHDVLASFIYAAQDFYSSSSDEGILRKTSSAIDNFDSALQYRWANAAVNVVSGIEHVTQTGTDVTNTVDDRGPNFSHNTGNLQFWDGHIYGTFQLTKSFTAIAGMSADYFNQQNTVFKPISRINPKLGLVWNITPKTTLRAAWFKFLKRPFVSNQTLQPTQIAGLNQFFDDINGSYGSRFGVGIDHEFSSTVFSGFEASWRDVEVPIIGQDSTTFRRQNEQFHRAYFYWTPAKWMSFGAEYFLEGFQNLFNNTSVNQFQTHRFPITLNFYHPNGLFASFGTEHVTQFIHYDPDSKNSDKESNFWTFDISAGYRFPKRNGLARIGFKNTFNQKFKFQDINVIVPTNPDPRLVPDQIFYGQVSLSF